MGFIAALGVLGFILGALVRVTLWWIDWVTDRLLNEVYDANANLIQLTERRRQRIARQLKGYRYDASPARQQAIDAALQTLYGSVIRTTPLSTAPIRA